MKVIFAQSALENIEDALDFMLSQGVPHHKISSLFDNVFDRVESLSRNPFLGQIEESISSGSKI